MLNNHRMNKILIGLLLCVVVVLLQTFFFENFDGLCKWESFALNPLRI